MTYAEFMKKNRNGTMTLSRHGMRVSVKVVDMHAGNVIAMDELDYLCPKVSYFCGVFGRAKGFDADGVC